MPRIEYVCSKFSSIPASHDRGKVIIREPELDSSSVCCVCALLQKKTGGQKSAAQDPEAKALVDHRAGLLVSPPRREGLKVTKGVKPYWEVLKQNVLFPNQTPEMYKCYIGQQNAIRGRGDRSLNSELICTLMGRNHLAHSSQA